MDCRICKQPILDKQRKTKTLCSEECFKKWRKIYRQEYFQKKKKHYNAIKREWRRQHPVRTRELNRLSRERKSNKINL